MIYLSLTFNAVLVLLLVGQHIAHFKRLDKERLEGERKEMLLLNRIQAPEIAVQQSLPDLPEQPTIPVDDSAYTDAQWAKHMEEIS